MSANDSTTKILLGVFIGFALSFILLLTVATIYYFSTIKTEKLEVIKNKPNIIQSDKKMNTLPNKPKIYKEKLKKRFNVGQFRFSVLAAAPVKRVYDFKAPKGAMIVGIVYLITNMSKNTLSLREPPIVLIDERGRRFLPSSDYLIQLEAHEQNSTLSELQPGLQRQLTVGFVVPKEILEHNITLEFSDPYGEDPDLHELTVSWLKRMSPINL